MVLVLLVPLTKIAAPRAPQSPVRASTQHRAQRVPEALAVPGAFCAQVCMYATTMTTTGRWQMIKKILVILVVVMAGAAQQEGERHIAYGEPADQVAGRS